MPEKTPEEIEAEEKVKAVELQCTENIDLSKKIDQGKIDAKIQEGADKITQALSEELEKALDPLIDVFIMLIEVISGFALKDPNKPDLDNDKILDKIADLLVKIVGKLTALPIPEIPGLSALQQLFDKLKEMNGELGDLPDLPDITLPELGPIILNTLKSLGSALASIATRLVLGPLQLLYSMVKALIGVVSGIPGCPAMPFPLTIIGDAISLLDDIWQLLQLFGPILSDIIMVKVKTWWAQIKNLSFPTEMPGFPEDLQAQPCPKHAPAKEGGADPSSITPAAPVPAPV